MRTLRVIFKIAFAKPTVVSGIQVALVVGIILNLINQWGSLITLSFQSLDVPKLLLTFLVPYLVSTYATIKAKL